TVHVHGAGAITETTDRHLMDCTTPSYSSETTVTDCFAGSHADGYASFDIVKLEASVPETYFTRGWRFVKWVDSSSAGKINCDPQGTTGNHFVTSCQFQIFDDLSADLYFDDVAAPSDTQIDSGPSGTTGATTSTFFFSAPSDPDASFDCRLDRPGVPVGSFDSCGSAFDRQEGYTTSTNGTYTFNVRARDPSGNVGSTVSRSWTVDTVGPTTTINGGPAAGSRTTSTSAGFSLTANEAANYQCKLDTPSGAGGFASCSSTPGYSGLADGTYTFSARGTDSIGNLGSTVSRTWTVDTQPPDTSISPGGPTGATSSNSPTFGFTSSEPNSTFECKLDSGAWETCTSTKGYTSLAEGEHTFRVRAIDASSLTDPTEAVRTWTVDTVTPDTSITSGPSGDTTSTTASFGLSASEPGASFECKLDSGAWEGCASGKTYSGLGTGPHTFLVRATDAAGNADQSEAVRGWTVTAPPSGGNPPGGTPPGGNPPGGTPPSGGADTTKPVATITFAKQKLARVLKAGFVGSAASTEGGRLRLDLVLGPKKLVVATSKSRALSGPGSMKLTAKFTRKAKKALGRMRKVKLTLRLTATDAAGNVAVKTRSVTLRR
ncbi:MAG TPA: hypothetical protein VK507_24365, partial [Iamia sp.]|nr:hypothetical protein [Iamia sp.]